MIDISKIWPLPLTCPPLLQVMIREGKWPLNHTEANTFNSRPIPLTPSGSLRAPQEDSCWLQPPPFWTLQERIDSNKEFWLSDMAAPDQIIHHKAVVIADFGIGSDAPIVLDYAHGVDPRVLRLDWPEVAPFDPRNNRWVEFAFTFEEWISLLDLSELCFERS